MIKPTSKLHAFTLVELLVVVGIIALLISILLPVTSMARRQAQKLQCSSQLRQIGIAVQFYANLNHDYLAFGQTGHLWILAGQTQLADPMSTKSYWGVPYAPLILPAAEMAATGNNSGQILTAASRLWHCPNERNLLPTLADPDYPVSYGLNGFITGMYGLPPLKTPLYRKITGYHDAAHVIFAHDACTFLINIPDNALSDFGSGTNLPAFRPGSMAYGFNPNCLTEFYRHNDQCNVLWLDGHVLSLPESFGTDIPGEWYEAPYNFVMR